MTTSTPGARKAFVISSFEDAGTGEKFEAGAITNLSAGAFANYKAAGLVRTPRAGDGKAKPTV